MMKLTLTNKDGIVLEVWKVDGKGLDGWDLSESIARAGLMGEIYMEVKKNLKQEAQTK